MDRKIIFLDIDGTLIAAMSEPSALATAAVRGARKMGHKVFLCTGRNMAIIGDDILKIGFDGVISSAGGHVEVGEEILFDSLLPEETVQECLDVFHDHGVYCRIETREGIYMDLQMEALLKSAKPDKRNSELIRMQKEIEKGIGILPYEEYPGKGAYKICFTSTTLEAIERTKPYLEGRFAYAVHMYGNSSSCFNGEPKAARRTIGAGAGCRKPCPGMDCLEAAFACQSAFRTKIRESKSQLGVPPAGTSPAEGSLIINPAYISSSP